jgi:DNA-binding NarL/FixJ family response regulator
VKRTVPLLPHVPCRRWAWTQTVSLQTIETHLSRIYSKLGLSGPGARRRLATALAEPAV